MIGRFYIDTSVFHSDSERYYGMLDPKVDSIVAVHIDNKVVHLKCTLSWGGTCEGCYFKTKGICPHKGHNSVGLACAPLDRFDGNHCVYVEVPTKKKNKEQPAEVKDYSGYKLKRDTDTNIKQEFDELNKLRTSQIMSNVNELNKLMSNKHFGLMGYRTNEDTLIKDDYLWKTI